MLARRPLRRVAVALPFLLAALPSAQVPGLEVGPDDFRISAMGPDGDPAFDGTWAAAAHDSRRGRTLVVWQGDDAAPGELEIYGQLLDEDGLAIGPTGLRISSMGPDGDPAFAALAPDVAYNVWLDEYVVVWSGSDATPGEFEVFAQRVSPDGVPFGYDDFPVSALGAPGDPERDACAPAIAAVQALGFADYVVVWHGDDQQDEAFAVYFQALDVVAGHVGSFQLRISANAPDASRPASRPDVVHTGGGGSLVVWQADPDGTGELEIYGRRMSAFGTPVGPVVRISSMGPDGDPAYEARTPALDFDEERERALVVWAGSDDTPGVLAVHGQLLDRALVAVGPDDFPLSAPAASVADPCVAWARGRRMALVAWSAEATPGEREIFVQSCDANGLAVGPDDARVSTMGPDGAPDYDAQAPALVFQDGPRRHLLVWHGDDDRDGLVEGEDEVRGQLLQAGCSSPATVQTRIAGTNQQTLVVPPLPIGSDVGAFAQVLPQSGAALLFAYRVPATVLLGGGQALLCVDEGGGEALSGAGLASIGVLSGFHLFELEVPADPALCGLQLTFQAIHFLPATFVLSNAVDVTVGG